MSEQNIIRWEQDADGIVVLTIDDPSQSANTMNDAYVRSMGATVDRLEREKANIKGVVITSGKKTFFAGGDLKLLIQARPEHAQQMFENVETMKAQLRRLETLGRPVVAALNGAALGGGLEIALACHHRVAVDDRKAEFGLPEVTLGLLPGGGGVTRTVRMFGLQKALMEVLLQGQRRKAAAAKEVGLIDELVASPEQLLEAAKAWARANPSAKQSWDVDGYKMPGGTPSTPKLAQMLPAFPANLRKQLKGANYPAPRAIMSAAVEGAQVDFDTASRIESRYFVSLATSQTAKNMTQAFFFDLQHINSGGSRPQGIERSTAGKVGVLGAGMMGAGIAYVCMRSGMDVVLKDVSLAAAEKGKAYSAKLLDKDVSKGRMTPEKRDELLARIQPTDQASALAGCDVVIEAVFENQALKHKVFQEVEDVILPDALLASNTSTLPITGLAEGVKRQQDFIGLHFFSPVDKMPLVEIIRGKKTSPQALARAYDVVLQLKKTPIVVNDSRGFFTSRVFGTLVLEGAALLGEGVAPMTIERAALTAGFPAGPLTLLDEVTLSLPQKIRNEARKAAEGDGRTFVDHPGMAVIDRMVDGLGRTGKAAGQGFFDWEPEKHVWPGLAEHFGAGKKELPLRDIQERMLFAMALETVKCLEEGVLTSVPDANIGSIFGIGFPPPLGGALQFLNQYEGGLKGALARAKELAAKYGERFAPPALLVQKAGEGETFA
jgi:3-hydroxyacyl-CoA dehydrogenase / enoyl-CoA hydratase / 3-hydroxybutyryl-CoA epimerase